MAISGRVPLLILLGLIPVVLVPAGSTVALWLVVVLIVCLGDWLRAPRPSSLSFVREMARFGWAIQPNRFWLLTTPPDVAFERSYAMRGNQPPVPVATVIGSDSCRAIEPVS